LKAAIHTFTLVTANVIMESEKNTLDILRTKIGRLSKENQCYNERIKVANSATLEAEERENKAEKKIKELTKQLTIRRIELNKKMDDHSNQIVQIKNKEEAAAEAKKEINVLLQKAILLKSEIDRVNNVLPKTAQNLCIASEKADNELKYILYGIVFFVHKLQLKQAVKRILQCLFPLTS